MSALQEMALMINGRPPLQSDIKSNLHLLPDLSVMKLAFLRSQHSRQINMFPFVGSYSYKISHVLSLAGWETGPQFMGS